MKVLASGKGLALRLHAGTLPLRPLRADPLRLRQVLLNLVGNAIKFTERGQITLRVQASEVAESTLRVHFAVEDTGIGMSEEQLGRVFEPFQQADGSTTRRFGGTGLGLSICKSLVTQMGGALIVRSEPGSGSVFEFELSFALGDPRRASQQQLQAVDIVGLLRARAARVLLAEDTEVNRDLLTRLLQHFGCKVESVDNGALAVERLTRDHAFDLVLMDWHMPVMDGIDAVTRVRRWEQEHARPRTPVIGVTASAFAEEVEQCRRAGMDEILSKPLSTSELQRVLCERLLLADLDQAQAPVAAAPGGAPPRLDRGMLDELGALGTDGSDFLGELLGEFLEAVREQMPLLQRYAQDRDWKRLHAAAHALRGSAAGVGAARLASELATLERFAQHDTQRVDHGLGGLAAELAHTEREIRALLSERSLASP
jgi:CheY-like chemotaxis protein